MSLKKNFILEYVFSSFGWRCAKRDATKHAKKKSKVKCSLISLYIYTFEYFNIGSMGESGDVQKSFIHSLTLFICMFQRLEKYIKNGK